MEISPAGMAHQDAYRVFMSIVVPRPIAWVSTISLDGVDNLAPFSMYTLLSTKPAIVGFAMGTARHGGKKDTLINIEDTKEFVINIANEETAEAMNKTSTPVEAAVSEFDQAGLKRIESNKVKPPRVGQSPVSMECQLQQVLEFGCEPRINRFVIGEVVLIHVRDELWQNGNVDYTGLQAIGRLGESDLYCRTTNVFRMKRP